MKPTCSERQGRTRTILRTLLHVWKLALCTQTSGIVAEASCVEEDAAGLCTRTSPEAVQDTRLPGDQVDSAWVVPLHSGGMNRVQMKQCLSALSLTRHWRKNYAQYCTVPDGGQEMHGADDNALLGPRMGPARDGGRRQRCGNGAVR